MASIHFNVDDKDLDDAELWAVIDSAAASHSASKSQRKPLNFKNTNVQSFNQVSDLSRVQKFSRNRRNEFVKEEDSRSLINGEVFQEQWTNRPQKMLKSGDFEGRRCFNGDNQIVVVKQRTASSYSSPDSGKFSIREIHPAMVESPPMETKSPLCLERQDDDKENFRHSLSGRFPSVSLFKQYQNAAMAILEKGDYTVIAGHPFIKKSGWRKISFFFNLSFEIKDKSIQFDQNQNVLRAEFVVRAFMQGGRFSDGWGSCERREKKFIKPNHDIPSTAETRAKTKACQDLLGIGEYQPGAKNSL